MTAGKVLFTGLFLFFTVCGFSQKNKSQLQKEKQQNIEKIKDVEKILKETTSKKKNSLGELNALNHRIRVQENLISSIRSEIKLLDDEIAENNGFIVALEEDLKELKEEYATLLFAAQKANNSASRLMFLFSAESFEQLVMRLQYMKQYGEKRKLQVEAIQQVQQQLSAEAREIEKQKAEKNKLLNEEVAENTNMTNLKKKQNTVVRSLEKEEKTLRRDLDETKKAIAKLDKMINDIIREEMERAAREAKAKNNSSVNVALSNSFEENRNKFSWPVNGFVSLGFGRQKHPVLKGVVIDNLGITIQTREGEKVKSIFDGEVREVAQLKILGNTILISHGEYYSVYAGLREVYVKKGQHVSTNQELGEVISNNEGIAELRFRIHKNTTPLDPQLWLRN